MILDASALLALLQGEPGADKVQAMLHRAIINTINWSEVIQKLSVHDPDAADIRAEMELTGLKIMPFTYRPSGNLRKPLGTSQTLWIVAC